ncbi:MAG TPA: PEP-CTERM sorting domain-containing protein [Pirellulales bacterium]|jgi:hypothetical protein|nr:PEP-CTERM sorting domain-containing protein [Pirellulales bacterium]
MHRSKLVLALMAALAVASAASQSRAPALTTLASFNTTDGLTPNGNLTLDGSTLYAMTSGGGFGDRTVFALALPEPSSAALLGFGAIGSGAMALRRTKRKQGDGASPLGSTPAACIERPRWQPPRGR